MYGIFYALRDEEDNCSKTGELKGNLWREDLVGAVEESPLLETVTKEELVKTQQTEKT
jgi:hypothetical protein